MLILQFALWWALKSVPYLAHTNSNSIKLSISLILNGNLHKSFSLSSPKLSHTEYSQCFLGPGRIFFTLPARCRLKIRSNNKFQWSFWRFFLRLYRASLSLLFPRFGPFFVSSCRLRRAIRPFTTCSYFFCFVLLFVWFWLLFYDLLLFVYVECVFECHCPVVSIAKFNQKAIFFLLYSLPVFILCPVRAAMPSLMAHTIRKKMMMKRNSLSQNKFHVQFCPRLANAALKRRQMRQTKAQKTRFCGAATEFGHFPFSANPIFGEFHNFSVFFLDFFLRETMQKCNNETSILKSEEYSRRKKFFKRKFSKEKNFWREKIYEKKKIIKRKSVPL